MHTPNPQLKARGGGERESRNRQAPSEEGVGRTGKEESRGKGASRRRENQSGSSKEKEQRRGSGLRG